jgi:hypothetical protein
MTPLRPLCKTSYGVSVRFADPSRWLRAGDRAPCAERGTRREDGKNREEGRAAWGHGLSMGAIV